MLTAMVISPHADDAAAFCGGTLAKFADQGWHVVLVRVTDDCKDSVGLTLEETRRRNTEELHRAAEILGIAEIVELGYETDCLADVSEVALRERFVYLFQERGDEETRHLDRVVDRAGRPAVGIGLGGLGLPGGHRPVYAGGIHRRPGQRPAWAAGGKLTC